MYNNSLELINILQLRLKHNITNGNWSKHKVETKEIFPNGYLTFYRTGEYISPNNYCVDGYREFLKLH